MPTGGASGGQVRRRRGSRRATVRPMDPRPTTPSASDPTEEPRNGPQGELDLLTIGLAVFFLSLILVVGALLILPAVF